MCISIGPVASHSQCHHASQRSFQRHLSTFLALFISFWPPRTAHSSRIKCRHCIYSISSFCSFASQFSSAVVDSVIPYACDCIDVYSNAMQLLERDLFRWRLSCFMCRYRWCCVLNALRSFQNAEVVCECWCDHKSIHDCVHTTFTCTRTHRANGVARDKVIANVKRCFVVETILLLHLLKMQFHFGVIFFYFSLCVTVVESPMNTRMITVSLPLLHPPLCLPMLPLKVWDTHTITSFHYGIGYAFSCHKWNRLMERQCTDNIFRLQFRW